MTTWATAHLDLPLDYRSLWLCARAVIEDVGGRVLREDEASRAIVPAESLKVVSPDGETIAKIGWHEGQVRVSVDIAYADRMSTIRNHAFVGFCHGRSFLQV